MSPLAPQHSSLRSNHVFQNYFWLKRYGKSQSWVPKRPDPYAQVPHGACCFTQRHRKPNIQLLCLHSSMLTSAFASMSLHGSCQASFASGQRLQQRQPLRMCGVAPFTVEAAHKKGGGSTKNGRDSKSKRRGVKVYGGQPIKAGGIIVRQLGTKVWHFSKCFSWLGKAGKSRLP